MGIIINGLTDTVTAADGSLNIGGDVTIPGELSYDDVTNVDSVGIITAQAGIRVTGGDILLTGGDGRKISFAGDGSAHYFKMDNTLNGPIINGYGGIAFETNGANERLRITSGGNIGIGTDNPGAALEVFGSTTSTMYIRGGGAGSDAARQATLGLYASGSKIYNLRADASDGSFRILDSSTERLRITSGGDFRIQWNNNNFLGSYYDADYYMGLSFGANTRELYIDNRSNDTRADIVFRTVQGQSNPTEKLRITSSGNIGIGSDSPATTLDVAGTVQFKNNGATLKIESVPGNNFTQVQFKNDGGSFYVGRENNSGNWFATGSNYASVLRSDGAYPLIFRVNGQNSLNIATNGNIGINHADPNTRLYVKDTGANISNGNAIINSTQKGIRVENSTNDDSSLGLWFSTGSHHSGISGQRNDYANTWGTDLRFYTHEEATNDLTYARERLRINPHGLLINRKGQNAVNTGGNILGRYKYTQLNQGSGYSHLILAPDGRKLQDYIGTNCYCIITVCVTGTGTDNMFCQYYYWATSSASVVNLTHMYGNNGASSNRPYMNLQNTSDPAWTMAHSGGYRVDIEVAIYGGANAFTFTDEFGDFTTNP